MRNERVACKGIVQPPQHRHEGAVQGAHGGSLYHGVGQHKIGTGGKAPQRRVHHAVAAGHYGGTGIQKQRQRAVVRRAKHHHFKAHAAQHRHGTCQHDGRTGHGQLVAQDQSTLSGGREHIVGTQLPPEVQQRLRDAAAVFRHGGGKAQQLGHAVPAARSGAHPVQKLPRYHGAAAARDVLGAQIKGGGAIEAKGGITHHKVGTGAQGGGKIGQGGGGALQIFADQQHALHRVGQGGGQLRYQPELAVQLVFQCVLQRLMTARCIHQQIGALGIGINLLRQLLTLQGAVTAVHVDNSFSDPIQPRSRRRKARSGAVSRQLLLSYRFSSESS